MYIKNIFFTICCICLFSIVSGQESKGWLTNYEEVYAKSIKENKPIMANFTGSDWCGWCKKLKKAVFDTELFQTWAKKNVVLFELDYPRRSDQPEELKKQNRELQQTFRQFVRGYPTILVFEKDAFKKWATNNIVLVELDFPKRTPISEKLSKQNRELGQMFGVRGYPTGWFVIPESDSGNINFKKLGSQGYVRGGAKAWITGANQILKNN